MGFPRQEYGSGLPFPSPGDLPDLGIKPESLVSPVLAGEFFTTAPLGKPTDLWIKNQWLVEESWLHQSPSAWHAVPQIFLFLLCSFPHTVVSCGHLERNTDLCQGQKPAEEATQSIPSLSSCLACLWLPTGYTQSEDSDVAYTNQPPGTEMRVYNGRENASGRVGDRLLVRMVPVLHSLCISTLCNLILQLCPSKCWVYFFIPWIWANLVSFDPKIWWKGCCVISMPKRPNTLTCSVPWEPALITSWEMEDCFPLRACMHANSLHACSILCNPFTVAHQAPLSVEFSKQKYWNGLPFPWDVPYTGIEAKSLTSPALAGGVFTTSTIWEVPLEVVKDALIPAHKTTDHTCISDPSQD